MSKQIKVVCLENINGKPVPCSNIEATINEMHSKGWSFLQLNTGAGGDVVNTWAYIVFER